jgi:hypothetical protein
MGPTFYNKEIMAVKTFGTEVLTSADTNTYLANSGLVYVTSQTIGTAVASVTVSNCFSATYDDYLITVDGVLGTAGASLNTTLITSGGADNAANWKGNTFYIAPGAVGGLSNSNLTVSPQGECGNINSTASSTLWNILGPFATRRTSINFQGIDATYIRIGNFILDNATSYVSMRLFGNTGTLTGGTITVYGYRKA